MSFEANVRLSMIEILEINKQHHCFSNQYACRIVLNDGREKTVDLQGSSLYSLVSCISQDKIRTLMDYESLRTALREDSVYGTFAEVGEPLISNLFKTATNSTCRCTILQINVF